MSTTAPTILEKPKSRSRSGGGGKGGGGSGGGGGGGSQATVRLRVAVRHLPSLLKEDEFREAMVDYVNDETTEGLTWTQGKIPADRNKLPVYSRCHIKFKTPTQITALNDALRAHGPFTDSKGNTTSPQMEYSPFQKFPKKGGRVDARAGTIDSDPDFIAFLASINGVGTVPTSNGTADGAAPAEGVASPAAGSALLNDPLSVPLPSGEKPEKPRSTPLIDFLRQQKAAAAAEKAAPKSKSEKSKDGKDGKEASSSSRRSEKRKLEKIRARGKDRDDDKEDKALKQAVRAVDMETATILKREGTAFSTLRRENSNMSASSPGRERDSKPEKSLDDKPKRERRRERGSATASVAAILQRDLGLTAPRRSRANKTALETATAIIEERTSTAPTPALISTNPPAINATLAAQDTPKTPRSRGGSRRDRRNRPEREDSAVSAPSPPAAPVAILKKASSALGAPSGPAVPTLLKRQSEGPPSGPSHGGNPTAVTPTAPKGSGRRHGRGEGRNSVSGGGGGRNARPPGDGTPLPQAMPGVPTAPAGDMGQAGRDGRGRRGSTGGSSGGGGGGRGGARFGRGRGGGQGKGRPGTVEG